MLVLLRQGKISKWFSGIGQEAIAVGATLAMSTDEWILPLHRNLGVFTGRGMPLAKLFQQWQGSPDGYSKGRERSFHFGSREYAICGMISHLGPQLGIADGIGLAAKTSGKRQGHTGIYRRRRYQRRGFSRSVECGFGVGPAGDLPDREQRVCAEHAGQRTIPRREPGL